MAKTILIVDDSSSVRQVIGIALRGAGYEVLEGRDGRDALTRLDGRKVHLIISDVNMPFMDGITFVKEVKALPSYRFTPVIMLTTETSDEKKREGQAAGAKAWVVKPFKPEVLLGAVQKADLAVMDAMPEHVLRLPPELTIYGAAELRARLADALVDAATAGGPLTLDLADVCEIDSAGLQLLMAARRDADARALALTLHAHSAAVSEALALFGLDDQARGGHHGS